MIQLLLSFFRRLWAWIFGDGEVVAQDPAPIVLSELPAVKEEETPQKINASTDPEEPPSRAPSVFDFVGKEEEHLQEINNAVPLVQAPPYTDAVRHNVHHSFFHRLPLDILYYLATNHIHDPADLLAFRASTRALRFSPIIHAPPLHYHGSRDFLKRLPRDMFTRACEAQDGGFEHKAVTYYDNSGSEPLVPCGACQRVHRRSLFSDAQLAARRHASRRCKGSTGVVRLCPHKTVTLAQLASIAAASLRVIWRPCRDYVWPRAFAILSATTYFTTRPDDMEFSVMREVRVYSEFDVAAGDGGGTGGSSSSSSAAIVADTETSIAPEIAWGIMKAGAERHGVVACNHMRLDKPETFESVFRRFTRRGVYKSNISHHSCRTRRCQGHLIVWWDYKRTDSGSFKLNYVRLNTTRYLGSSKSADDEKWLAQIEDWE